MSPSTPSHTIGNCVESNLKRIGGSASSGSLAADPVQAAAHVVGGDVQVRAVREVEGDAARALRGGRGELFQAGGRADRLLDGPRDALLDLARADARVADTDREAREAHVRHQVDRQLGQRDRAQQHDDRADHGHRDGSFNRGARNAHRRIPGMAMVAVIELGSRATEPQARARPAVPRTRHCPARGRTARHLARAVLRPARAVRHPGRAAEPCRRLAGRPRRW